MPEEIFEKTTNWPKIILTAILGFGLLVGAAYAGYWYGTQEISKLKVQISNLRAELAGEAGQLKTQNQVTPTSIPTPTLIDRIIPPPGGDCRYGTYQGVCTITSIERTEESKHQREVVGGPRYEGYEIRYLFESTDTIPQEWQESLLKEHTLQLANSWYPGPQFIEKYEIEPNRRFDCAVRLITKGTCSPVIFDFEDIDTTDYFETSQ